MSDGFISKIIHNHLDWTLVTTVQVLLVDRWFFYWYWLKGIINNQLTRRISISAVFKVFRLKRSFIILKEKLNQTNESKNATDYFASFLKG